MKAGGKMVCQTLRMEDGNHNCPLGGMLEQNPMLDVSLKQVLGEGCRLVQGESRRSTVHVIDRSIALGVRKR
jgi:hypothetical protein